MAAVYLGIGSNVDRQTNLIAAVKELRRSFNNLRISPVYESRAHGFDGDNFYNFVVHLDTAFNVENIIARLREIERLIGRDRTKPRLGPSKIDIDLLLYDGLIIKQAMLELPRAEILTRAYVLKPLADLAGQDLHPVTGQCYEDIWLAFEDQRHSIWQVPFDWASAK